MKGRKVLKFSVECIYEICTYMAISVEWLTLTLIIIYGWVKASRWPISDGVTPYWLCMCGVYLVMLYMIGPRLQSLFVVL